MVWRRLTGPRLLGSNRAERHRPSDLEHPEDASAAPRARFLIRIPVRGANGVPLISMVMHQVAPPEILVEDTPDKRVLFLDCEELVGAK
ncbi:MAG: hypothetical protein GY946_23365 [bacterium]|nr:hypothetical protein [bacterium]